jgi:hypothetical protein
MIVRRHDKQKSPPVHHRQAPVAEANSRIPVHPWEILKIGNL